MITRKRDLRTGFSLWEGHKIPKLAYGQSPKADFYDVVVIGCGISGSLISERLCNLGLRILAVDRRRPASGSTSASTALIQWEIDQPLVKLAKQRGWKTASSAYLASVAAVKALQRRIRTLGVDCEMAPRDTLLLAGDAMGKTALAREVKQRRRLGLPSVLLDQKGLLKKYGFDREAAIESKGSIELNPVQLSLGMLKLAMNSGVEVVAPLNVIGIDATSKGVFVSFENGRVIAARKVIVASGYEMLPELPNKKYDLVSTWALATVKQMPNQLWPHKVLVWEASDPYLYFRTTHDNRIVVGGEDASYSNPERRDRQIKKKSQKILQKFGVLWPAATLKADYQWAGTFAESPTGMPIIGEVPELPNVFAVLGAGGNGITFSCVASDLAKSWVQNKAHKLAPLFAIRA
ncbi:MAG: FAD-dependent oxidoreductase [Aestuariivirga sp.]